MRKALKISSRFLLILGLILLSLRPSIVNRVMPGYWHAVQTSSSPCCLQKGAPLASNHLFMRCSFNKEDKHQAMPALPARSFVDSATLAPLMMARVQDHFKIPVVACLRPAVLRI
jgi:hypothetical protein